MKSIFTLTLICFSLIGFAQTNNPNFDSNLAQKLGADAYGMKSYVFVLLKSGTNTSTDKELKDICFAGHLQNIHRLVDENKMIVAGPFGKNEDDMRGLFILDVPTVEEAELLMQTDPAVKAAFLKPVFYQWYGSAALPVYLEASDKIWTEKP